METITVSSATGHRIHRAARMVLLTCTVGLGTSASHALESPAPRAAAATARPPLPSPVVLETSLSSPGGQMNTVPDNEAREPTKTAPAQTDEFHLPKPGIPLAALSVALLMLLIGRRRTHKGRRA